MLGGHDAWAGAAASVAAATRHPPRSSSGRTGRTYARISCRRSSSASASSGEIEIRHRQQDEEDQRIEDEQDADSRVTSGKVRNGGGEQGDPETEIGELFDLRRHPRDQKRRDAQYLGDRQFHLEVIRQAQMNEASFRDWA